MNYLCRCPRRPKTLNIHGYMPTHKLLTYTATRIDLVFKQHVLICTLIGLKCFLSQAACCGLPGSNSRCTCKTPHTHKNGPKGNKCRSAHKHIQYNVCSHSTHIHKYSFTLVVQTRYTIITCGALTIYITIDFASTP